MLKNILNSLIGVLPKRQKDIISQRFGLVGKGPKTLAAIGDKYSITRERVRQIEEAALKSLKKSAEGNKDLKGILDKCVSHLEKLGGIRKADLLADDVGFILSEEKGAMPFVELLFDIFKTAKYRVEDNDFYGFWYTKPEAVKEVKRFVDKIEGIMKSKKEMLIEKKKFDEVFHQVVKDHKVQDFVALNFMLVSKKFATSPFGDFGLAEWREIVPKTMRDKSYIVLKKRGEAMHFTGIAKEIDKMKFDVKRAHPQTVHNELIKDKRFVLVGRGLYSLREFGIEAGTTVEVLHKILKKHGPKKLDEIVQLISQQRILKKGTILLNLQNKKYFKKIQGGLYHVA